MATNEFRMVNILVRCVLTLVALGVMTFCVFGFLASNEFKEVSRRLPWQMGYGAGFAVGMLGIVSLWRRPVNGPEKRLPPRP